MAKRIILIPRDLDILLKRINKEEKKARRQSEETTKRMEKVIE